MLKLLVALLNILMPPPKLDEEVMRIVKENGDGKVKVTNKGTIIREITREDRERLRDLAKDFHRTRGIR